MTSENKSDEILIVEDSPTQAEMLKFMLEKHNYQVSVASNGREALDMINKRKPAIVISDIVMPEMDGYELCRLIKENESFQDIPVILLTVLSDPKDVIKGLEVGADNFFTKPYDEEYLIARLQHLLANKTLRGREKVEMGIRMVFGEQEYYITAERQQILNLLLSTYETAVQKNIELQRVQDELRVLNEELEKRVEERTASLMAEMEVRKRAEENLNKVNRALMALSHSNHALLHAKNESELLNEMCRIIVDVAGYRLAWVGFAEQDRKKTVRPVAQYGYEEGYLDTLKITWADEKSCAGKAIRTGKVCVVKNILTDQNYVAFRADAIRRGYASYITVPLDRNEHPSGALCIYAKEPDAFAEGEINLLTEMTDDLSFGIMALRMRAEREQAEKEITEMASIIKNIPESVCIMDLNGNILSWNEGAEKMLGYTKEEIVGKPITITIPEKLAQKEFEHCIGTLNAIGFFTDYESTRITKDGRTIPVEITAAALKDKEQNITSYASIIKDITERKKAEEIRLENERLAAADKAKSEFLANMSHELRTPLNSIIGFSELMKQGVAGKLNEKQEHFTDNIFTSGKFLLALINDILDLSKIEAGKIELTPEKISVPATIKETLSLIKEKAVKHNVLLKTEFDPKLEFIEADKQRFKQILFNLLSNAVKFSKEEEGTVTIRAKKEGDMAKVSVSDTGIGIKEENMKKLFHKFEQLDSKIAKKYGGTGLGLAITKQLVELHGGKIRAESKFGEGSTFTFLLPVEAKGKG